MSEDRDFEMRDEYDFSGGVRGRHAVRRTPGEREEVNRRAAAGTAQALLAHAFQEIAAVEAAIFTFLVLARDSSPEDAVRKAVTWLDGDPDQVAEHLRAHALADGHSEARFGHLATERYWLIHKCPDEMEASLAVPERTWSIVERLERIAEESQALKAHLQRLVEDHLAHGGLSRQDIERRTGETARLWRSAA